MKNIILLLLLFPCFGLYSQNLSKINADLNLTDSLTYETEVRIYQTGGITNYSSLFRMYMDKSEKWTAEFYERYLIVNGITESEIKKRTEKRTLKSENDLQFIFLNLLRSHILDLPSLNEIQWKLITRGNVEKVKKQQAGKTVEEYDLKGKKLSFMDGEGYKIQVKGWKANEFEFSDPESYLKHYPEVDELIYMCEILNTIRSEFGIWKK